LNHRRDPGGAADEIFRPAVAAGPATNAESAAPSGGGPRRPAHPPVPTTSQRPGPTTTTPPAPLHERGAAAQTIMCPTRSVARVFRRIWVHGQSVRRLLPILLGGISAAGGALGFRRPPGVRCVAGHVNWGAGVTGPFADCGKASPATSSPCANNSRCRMALSGAAGYDAEQGPVCRNRPQLCATSKRSRRESSWPRAARVAQRHPTYAEQRRHVATTLIGH